MEPYDEILRTVLAFFALLLVARVMGRKAISQMTFFDFTVAITLGSVTANLSLGNNPTILGAVLVLFTLCLMGVLFDILHLKSFRFRKLINSEPVTLIENGHIIKENMKRTRFTMNDLNALLREKNTFNIADVEFAIIECDGKLSVLPKSQKQPVTPSDLKISTPYVGLVKEVIIDGSILNENLKDAKLDKDWLMRELNQQGIQNEKNVFFAALDTQGNLYVSKGHKGKESWGEHGIE